MSQFPGRDADVPDLDEFARRLAEQDRQRTLNIASEPLEANEPPPPQAQAPRVDPVRAQAESPAAQPQQAQPSNAAPPPQQQQQQLDLSVFRDILSALSMINDDTTAIREALNQMTES